MVFNSFKLSNFVVSCYRTVHFIFIKRLLYQFGFPIDKGPAIRAIDINFIWSGRYDGGTSTNQLGPADKSEAISLDRVIRFYFDD